MASQIKRQQPIPVTSKERAELEKHKLKYETLIGRHIDWGEFLVDMIKWCVSKGLIS